MWLPFPVLNVERFVCLRIPPSIVKWQRMRRLFPDELFSFRARRRSDFYRLPQMPTMRGIQQLEWRRSRHEDKSAAKRWAHPSAKSAKK
jgi:hypothetical protein